VAGDASGEPEAATVGEAVTSTPLPQAATNAEPHAIPSAASTWRRLIARADADIGHVVQRWPSSHAFSSSIPANVARPSQSDAAVLQRRFSPRPVQAEVRAP
jgi:hypothetical protein